MIYYPTHIEVKGVEYPINQHWRVGLECTNVIEDKELTDQERAVEIIVLVLGDIPDSVLLDPETLDKVTQYLLCEKEPSKTTQKRVMDYNQDMTVIWSSIKADYGVDIFTDNINWYEFNNMIEGLTGKTALMQRIEIRLMNAAEEKDPKRKKAILDAQKQVALKGIDDEPDIDDKTLEFLRATGRQVK